MEKSLGELNSVFSAISIKRSKSTTDYAIFYCKFTIVAGQLKTKHTVLDSIRLI